MWQRFSKQARMSIYAAMEEAKQRRQDVVSTEYLLLGLLTIPDSAAVRLMARTGATPNRVREEMNRRLGEQGQLIPEARPPGEIPELDPSEEIPLSPAIKQVVEYAFEEARQHGADRIRTEHLLAGILREGKSLAAEILAPMGVTLERVRSETSDTVLSVEEALQVLGTSKPTLYRLLRQGDLKGLKVGRQWRFQRADLMAYMERSPVAVSAAPIQELETEIERAADRLRDVGAEIASEDLDLADQSARRINLLARLLISFALSAHASDIHLEPSREDGQTFVRVRHRVDGVLHEINRLPMRLHEPLFLSVKQMADLDINEKRLPQDGRILMPYDSREYDLRMSTVPSMFGESMTLRIMDRTNALIGLDRLGLTPENLATIRDVIHQPNGLVVISGPTGSGRTTLLYSCLQMVANGNNKTLTIEDPVEYLLPYTTQMQMNRKMGFTFPVALRAIMRQDPDIIMVGKMRDLETLEMSVEAVLTGHLLLTTVHANGAAEAIRRLLEMGLAPHLLASTLICVVNLRLARKVCANCSEENLSALDHPVFTKMRELAREGGYEMPPDGRIVYGRGCETCRNTGYRGRTGLCEVLTVNTEIAEALIRGASSGELEEIAIRHGMRILAADGMRKVAEGVTTAEEVMRVVASFF